MSELENQRGRREIIVALIVATENAPRLLDVCMSTHGDEGALVRAVRDAFGVNEVQAGAMLAMPMRRMTPGSLDVLRAELVEVDDRLRQLEGPD